MALRENPDKLREYKRNWMRNRRNEFFDGKECVSCGSTKELHIHHLDPSQKVSHRIWSWSKERRIEELKKCIILCAICHRLTHKTPIPHGTATGYKHRKCRCDKCKSAHAREANYYKLKKLGKPLPKKDF